MVKRIQNVCETEGCSEKEGLFAFERPDTPLGNVGKLMIIAEAFMKVRQAILDETWQRERNNGRGILMSPEGLG